MCMKTTCYRCGRLTWAGCGQHVDQVLRDVPQSYRCQCATTMWHMPMAAPMKIKNYHIPTTYDRKVKSKHRKVKH